MVRHNDGNFVLSLSNYDLFLLCVQSHLPHPFGRLCVQLRELHCLDVVYALVVHVFLSLKLLACERWLSILMEHVYWLPGIQMVKHITMAILFYPLATTIYFYFVFKVICLAHLVGCVQLRELHCLDVVYALVVHVFLSLKLLACGRWLSILMECVYWLLHRCCHPSFIDVTSFTIAY
jgi:hypothetical protein